MLSKFKMPSLADKFNAKAEAEAETKKVEPISTEVAKVEKPKKRKVKGKKIKNIKVKGKRKK